MLLKRHLLIFSIFIIITITGLANAELFPVMYRCDGNTPLEWLDPNVPYVYKDIMVGTHLVIEIGSDTADRYDQMGEILLFEPYLNTCTISGRDLSDESIYLEGSILPAAGNWARAFPPTGGIINGRSKYSLGFRASYDAIPGPWFVYDYMALTEGPCELELHTIANSNQIYITYLIFEHVPSRDFNDDGKVNMNDFARMAQGWRENSLIDPNTSDPNDVNQGNLDKNGIIDTLDLKLFCDYWLVRTKKPVISE